MQMDYTIFSSELLENISAVPHGQWCYQCVLNRWHSTQGPSDFLLPSKKEYQSYGPGVSSSTSWPVLYDLQS